MVQCTIPTEDYISELELDDTCKKAIVNVEAKRLKKPFYLRVKVAVSARRIREEAEQALVDARQGPERLRLKKMTRYEIEMESARMNDLKAGQYFAKYGVRSPFALVYAGENYREYDPYDHLDFHMNK